MTNKVDIKLVHSKDGFKATATWGEVEVVIDASGVEPAVLLHEVRTMLSEAMYEHKSAQ